jgi:hypothetical protein
LRGKDLEDHGWRPVWEKKFTRDSFSANKKLGMVACTCYGHYIGNVNKKIAVQASLGINTRPYWKNK